MVNYGKMLLLDKFSNSLPIRWRTTSHLGVNIANLKGRQDIFLPFLRLVYLGNLVAALEAKF